MVSSFAKAKDKMKAQEFNQVLEAQMKLCQRILGGKAQEYATDVDRLHNFKLAAALKDETQTRALAGMMVKHTVSVYDMCLSGDEYPLDIWEEKITDHINYLILLQAVVIEEAEERVAKNA